MRSTPLSAATCGTLCAAALLTVMAGPADAANGRLGVRETVCAQTLFVRTDPGGAWMGTLKSGQTFTVERLGSGWVYGFAFGDINRHGWVQDGWFC